MSTKHESNSALSEAIRIAGSQAALASKIDYTQQAISTWLKTKVPGEAAVAIERALNGEVTKEQLRPDIFEVQQ